MRAGGRKAALAPLYRRNDDRRVNAKTDEFRLDGLVLAGNGDRE